MHADLLLLASALLSVSSGGTSENLKIQAFAGNTAILPCSISLKNDNPTVEWTKEGLEPDTVFLYRDGCETYEIKNPAFRYRTNLFLEELKNGNVSLRISNLQLSDEGTYICTLVQTMPQEVARLELVVAAVSEPKLSVVAQDGGVTVQCEASCWKPEPEITFVDEHGNIISAADPKTNLDSTGCFTVTRRATLQAASKSITCRVHQPDINQTRITDLFLFQDKSWSSCAVAIAIAIIICALISISCTIFCRSCICEGLKKKPVPNASTSTNQADGERNVAAEHQRMSVLHEEDKTTQQISGEVNVQRSPSDRSSLVVWQHEQPTLENSPSASPPDVSQSVNLHPNPTNLSPHESDDRTCPKPGNSPKRANSKSGNSLKRADSKSGNSPKKADSKSGTLFPVSASRNSVLTDNGAVSLTSEKGHVDRSMSFSKPKQNSASVNRRHTISAPLHNRISIPDTLSEDTEPLIK